MPIHIKIVAGPTFNPTSAVTGLQIHWSTATVTAGTLTSSGAQLADRTVIAATRASDSLPWTPGADLVSFCGGVDASGCSSLTLAGLPKYKIQLGVFSLIRTSCIFLA